MVMKGRRQTMVLPLVQRSSCASRCWVHCQGLLTRTVFGIARMVAGCAKEVSLLLGGAAFLCSRNDCAREHCCVGRGTLGKGYDNCGCLENMVA